MKKLKFNHNGIKYVIDYERWKAESAFFEQKEKEFLDANPEIVEKIGKIILKLTK